MFLFYFSYRLQARIKTTPFQATGFELCATVFIRVNIILAVLAWEVCHFHQGYVDMNLPHEVHPIVRKSRLPNYQPFRQISCNNDIFKFSFYPRTIVTWNNLHSKLLHCLPSDHLFDFVLFNFTHFYLIFSLVYIS